MDCEWFNCQDPAEVAVEIRMLDTWVVMHICRMHEEKARSLNLMNDREAVAID